jgi:hypothetical protein
MDEVRTGRGWCWLYMARAGVNAGQSVIDRPRGASAKINAFSDEWAVVEFGRLMIIETTII